jgi:hypothetical protein
MIGGKKEVKDLTRLSLLDCQTAQLVHMFEDSCMGSHPPAAEAHFSARRPPLVNSLSSQSLILGIFTEY